MTTSSWRVMRASVNMWIRLLPSFVICAHEDGCLAWECLEVPALVPGETVADWGRWQRKGGGLSSWYS
jgi:hypothetical protein